MLDKNVTLIRSGGTDCGICGQKIGRGEPAVRVKFDVPVLFMTTSVDRELHLECAENLTNTIRRRLHEAGWK